MMLKIISGIICIALGITLLIISISTIFPAIFLIILGIGFIIFRKDENQIEKRKDISLNKRKSKK